MKQYLLGCAAVEAGQKRIAVEKGGSSNPYVFVYVCFQYLVPSDC